MNCDQIVSYFIVMHKINLCPLCDQGMTFKSMLNLGNEM